MWFVQFASWLQDVCSLLYYALQVGSAVDSMVAGDNLLYCALQVASAVDSTVAGDNLLYCALQVASAVDSMVAGGNLLLGVGCTSAVQ